MITRITVKATRPDGVTMYWSDYGWTSHESDAHDFRTHEAAGQAVSWDRELRHMTSYGFTVDILEVRV